MKLTPDLTLTLPPLPCPLVLASASPRRRELLGAMGQSFTVRCADVPEDLPNGIDPQEAVLTLARRKCAAVLPLSKGCAVIAADTVVALDGKILGKPKSEEDALAMLTALSGRTHEVFTGVAVGYGDSITVRADRTAVTFRPLSREEILAYIKTGEPMDKAGAYGIQGGAGHFAVAIDGALDNVIGLPTRLLADMLMGELL